MIDVVYAMATQRVALPSGDVANVHKGQHWPSTDQVVRLRPDLFTTDARYGLLYSEPPPGYDGQLEELPEAEFEAATAVPGEKRSARRGERAS